MSSKYPEAFIEQALVKVYSRGHRSVKSVADDLNVNHHTLKYWMKIKVVTNKDAPPKPTSVALDEKTIQELKALAEIQGIPYQVLIRVFILDGLDRLKKAA